MKNYINNVNVTTIPRFGIVYVQHTCVMSLPTGPALQVQNFGAAQMAGQIKPSMNAYERVYMSAPLIVGYPRALLSNLLVVGC